MGFSGQNHIDTFFIPVDAPTGITPDGTRYFGFGSVSQFASEPNLQTIINFPFSIVQMSLRVTTNAKTADTLISFRADSVNIHLITVPTLVLARFESTFGAVAVASGALCNVLVNTSASTGAQNFSIAGWNIWGTRP